MKKHLASILVVSLTLLVVWSTFARAEEGETRGRRRRPGSDRPAARGVRPGAAGLQGLSAEQRQQMRQRFENMSSEEREKFRAEMRERLGQRPRQVGPAEAPRLFERQIEQLKKEQEQAIGELKEILEMARKEKATETAKRLEALIAKRQKAFEQRMKALEDRRQRFDRMRQDRPDRPAEPRQPRGKPAPAFKLKGFDGKEVSLAGLKGKIVVLEWMNFECPFSRYHYETKTTMANLAKKYKSKDVVWLAVNSTNHTTAAKNIAYAKKQKIPFPILNDIPGKVGKAYGAKTTPHIIVIDKAGYIAYNGAIDNAPLGKVPQGQEYVNYVADALDAVIAGKAVTTPQTKPYGCTVKYAK